MEKTTTLTHGELQIPCKIYDTDFGAVKRVIIGVHGFGSSKESAVIGAIAEEMSFYNTSTICFDFPGHGESPLSARWLSLKNCETCLLIVAQYAKELWPEAEEFGILASSFGAYLTLLTMDDLQECLPRIKLVLRAPAVRMAKTLLGLARMDEAQFLKKGRIVWGFERKMEVPYSFYEDLQVNNAVADYDMPMMIVQGDCDEVVDIEDVEFFRLLNGKAKLVMIPGASHRFNHEGDLDMIVDLARDWFLCEDVLLSEWR